MPKDVSALQTLAKLWRQERDHHRQRDRARREGTTIREREAAGLALRDLAIEETDATASGRTILWLGRRQGGGLDGLRAGPGTPVILWWDAPDGADATRGIVRSRRGRRLAVVVDGTPDPRLDDGGFRLDIDAPTTTFDRGAKAIHHWSEAKKNSVMGHLRARLFGDAAPTIGPLAPLDAIDRRLNAPQRRAIQTALATEDIALIHGPPGTGKTRTLVEIVRQAVRSGERVLATAASNAAVDHLAECLIDAGIAIVRVGHPARVSESVEALTLDAQVAADPTAKLARGWLHDAAKLQRKAQGLRGFERRALQSEAKGLANDARGQLTGIRRAVLARASVVCLTATGASAPMLRALTFDRVVLDEATQAPDPLALIALSHAPLAVLAGDPCQLPPTVLSRVAERAGLGRTCFERLLPRAGDAAVLLEVQYRMHERLMRHPSDRWYGGRLRAFAGNAAHRLRDLPGVQDDPLRPGPLVLIDCAGAGWAEEQVGNALALADEGRSTRNPEQAERTVLEVRRLLSRGLPASALGVITPYDGQRTLLRQRLASEREAGLEIDSVDGFQGREKEAIVLDLVRSNDRAVIGFLADPRRLNVALTRARRLLIIIADSATIGPHPEYAALFAALESGGHWGSIWGDEAPPWSPSSG